MADVATITIYSKADLEKLIMKARTAQFTNYHLDPHLFDDPLTALPKCYNNRIQQLTDLCAELANALAATLTVDQVMDDVDDVMDDAMHRHEWNVVDGVEKCACGARKGSDGRIF